MQETINRQEYVLRQKIKLYGCAGCPYFVNEIKNEDGDEEYKEGYCDLTRKNVSMRILTRPRWCQLRRKKNDDEEAL
jgi:Fe-S cluster assembly iron-binding protein IscA